MTFVLRPTFLLIALLLGWACVSGVETTQVQPLAVATAEQWTVRAQDQAGASLRTTEDWLHIRFKATAGATARLLLRTPVAIPAWATDLSFISTNNGANAQLCTLVVVRDAHGEEFLYHTAAPPSFERGMVYFTHPGHRMVATRYRTPGIARPKPTPLAAATLEGPHPNTAPTPPLTWIGLQLDGLGQEGYDTELYLHDFSFTAVTPATTRLHYLWQGRECFVEADGMPSLSASAVAARWYGKRYALTWEARTAYAGQPVLSGAAEIRPPTMDWEASGPGAEHPLILAKPLDLPLDHEGTYWVRVKSRWSREGERTDEIHEEEYRLDVISSATATPLVPLTALPPTARPEGAYLRLAPDAPELIFAAGTPTTLRLACWKPDEAVDRVRVELLGRTPQVWTAQPQWVDGAFTMNVPLPALAEGAYRVRATLLDGEREVDRSERTIGMRGGVAAVAKPPAGILTWKQALTRREPLFSLAALLPDDRRVLTDEEVAWDEQFKPFLDRAGEVSHDIEVPANWRTCEPLPGVYDFRALDRFLDHAGSKGLSVLIRPEFRAWETPDWAPGRFERNERGFVQGHPSYTFQGGRLNVVHSPELRAAYHRFITALTGHFTGHPALQGWMLCYEHPGDAAFAGWREGYAPETVQGFRTAMAAQRDLAATNARWGTGYRAWTEVAAPRSNASQAYWFDWLQFRCVAVNDLLKEFVTVVRERDSVRPIVMYRDGVTDFPWFRDHGCSFANGGSHDAMGLLEYAANDAEDLQERTEDHSPGDWTAYFPSQPDASLFAMLAGGWRNTSCKAFVFTSKYFTDLADRDRSLGRYRRLLPLWTELRQTKSIGYQVMAINDLTGPLLQDHAMGFSLRDPWETLNVAQAQVPACLGRPSVWSQAKLLVAGGGHRIMTRAVIDQLITYVEGGGTLLMRADEGRACIEEPTTDWVLLERFGFTRPTGEVRNDVKTVAAPRDGRLWGAPAGSFMLRDTWAVLPPAAAQTEALFPDGGAALSWRAFGKGRIAVLWAQTLLPPMYGVASDTGFPLYRAAAAWAGVDLPTASDNRLFWTNFLVGNKAGDFYGLAHLGQWQGEPSGRESTRLHWLRLPPGRYRITELLSGRDLGEATQQQLAGDGLPLELGAREAAVFRFSAINR